MKKRCLNIAGFLDNSLVNGDGMRSVVFVSGCTHNCSNCHNRMMQNRDYGEKIDVDEVFGRVMSNYPLIKGVTFSGGEPFENSEGLSNLARKIKENSDMNIWCYTGYSFEELIKEEKKEWKELLEKVDVLIDGKFYPELKDETLRYRGSKNQRILDVKRSLKERKAIVLN